MTPKLINKLQFFANDKKIRYLILSIILTLLVYFLSIFIADESSLFYLAIFILLLGLIGLVISSYSTFFSRSLIYSMILPGHLIVGFLFMFFYFPTLGPIIELIAFFSLATLFYIIFLVNNVFLVVEEKGSVIPLYDAAVTWVQILIIVVSIPYISGVYKIPIDLLVQNTIMSFSILLFCFYMIWVMSLDSDVKRTGKSEKVFLAWFLTFITFSAGVSVSLIPTESFLRALFIASLLMFDLAYIFAHYKNKLNLRMILEYGVISLIFFIVLLIFRP